MQVIDDAFLLILFGSRQSMSIVLSDSRAGDDRSRVPVVFNIPTEHHPIVPIKQQYFSSNVYPDRHRASVQNPHALGSERAYLVYMLSNRHAFRDGKN